MARVRCAARLALAGLMLATVARTDRLRARLLDMATRLEKWLTPRQRNNAVNRLRQLADGLDEIHERAGRDRGRSACPCAPVDRLIRVSVCGTGVADGYTACR